MPSQPEPRPLVARLGQRLAERSLSDASRTVTLAAMAGGTILGGRAGDLAGRSVLIATATQLAAAMALVELDGLARRILLAPPDLAVEHRPAVIEDAGIDAVVTDDPEAWRALGVGTVLVPDVPPVPAPRPDRPPVATEWLMLTSGTTGRPKIVAHTLDALTGAIGGDAPSAAAAPVWATFYDIRRYGGLQILLRALIAGGSLVLSAPGEDLADHIARLVRCGVSHISGTPSHWRKALMSSAIGAFRPGYVRLSGEIADQAVLDGLRQTFPDASIGHAYASTEAGVGFAVDDGLEGFPAHYVGRPGPVEMKVVDGVLHIRSRRAALGYVGDGASALMDADGFVDTGDMVEQRGDRFHFVGRRGGIINVGGLKVHPEEVEAAINRHPLVRMSRVKARKSPITGSIVVADVVLTRPADPSDVAGIKAEILAGCRETLPGHKIPALIAIVPAIEVAPSGKLVRNVA